jgi:hypothetical protein
MIGRRLRLEDNADIRMYTNDTDIIILILVDKFDKIEETRFVSF